MTGPVRLGLASFAHHHAEFWAEAIATEPRARLVGVWDDDRARGRAAAGRHGVPYFSELEALLGECDAIGVTCETTRHASVVEQAAAAGVHILCEKPLAATLEDCDRIERAVAAAGVSFMQNFPKRFDPVNQELLAWIRRGDLGRITLVRVRHGHPHGTDPHFQRQWFTDPTLSGGGALLDEGVHAADLLLWLLGAPVEVTAATSHAALGLRVEDTAAAVFTFPDGALAEVTTSWAFAASESSIEVYGTEGAAVLSGVDLASRPFARPPYLRRHRRGAPPGRWEASAVTPSFVAGEFHQQGPRHFVRALRDGIRPAPGVREGRRAVEMVLAAYAAAAEGRRCPVRLTAPEP